MEKLATLPRVVHDAASLTCDAQQVNGNQIVLIFVSGRLSIDESNPLNFSETFLLLAGAFRFACGQANWIYRRARLLHRQQHFPLKVWLMHLIAAI